MTIQLKRAYETPAGGDGQRVLVDRLWPRGVTKAKAGLDVWLRDVAPSTELRQWFDHDPAKWAEFGRRYRAELRHNPALAQLRELAQQGPITLVYAARDEQHNAAVVLRQVLRRAQAGT